jgi:hypothetical protein
MFRRFFSSVPHNSSNEGLRSEAPDPAVPSPSWLPEFFMAARGGQEEGRDDDDSQSFGADETAPDVDMTGKSTRMLSSSSDCWMAFPRNRSHCECKALVAMPCSSSSVHASFRMVACKAAVAGCRFERRAKQTGAGENPGAKVWRARASKAVHCRGFEITLCTLVTGRGVLLTTRCGFIDSEDGRLEGGRLFGGDFFVERSSRSKVLKLPRRSVASRGAAVVWQEFPIR